MKNQLSSLFNLNYFLSYRLAFVSLFVFFAVVNIVNGQDLPVTKYETSEYTMYYDKQWRIVEGNNIVQWYIQDQFGGTQYNLVVEEGLGHLENNISLYLKAAIDNMPTVISRFKFIKYWDGIADNSVAVAYEGVIGDQPSTFLQYYILSNDKAYILTSRFEGKLDDDQLSKLADMMMFLFHIK